MRVLTLSLIMFGICMSYSEAASICTQKTCVDLTIVSKQEEMMRGLQGREKLSPQQGMLFAFKTDDRHRFWMKDMKISIDMLWLDQRGTIVSIAASRPPCKQDPCEVYTPSEKSRYVLEVVDGFAAQNQLKVGDTLQLKDIN